MKPYEQKRGYLMFSHMGEVDVKGFLRRRFSFLQKMLTNDISKLQQGGAQYTAMCYEKRRHSCHLCFIVYKRAEDDYLLVVNAAEYRKRFQLAASEFNGRCPNYECIK